MTIFYIVLNKFFNIFSYNFYLKMGRNPKAKKKRQAKKQQAHNRNNNNNNRSKKNQKT